MRRLQRPPFTVREALDLCVSSIRDVGPNGLKVRLQGIATSLENAEAAYSLSGEGGQLFSIAETDGVDGTVSTKEMERVYAQTFVKSTRTRPIYDAIKKLPVNDICPLCGQRTVFTLDHYLPQTKHPALVITSVNLVPACGECNKIKLNLTVSTEGQQTLHPYFDNVDDAQWLFASVLQRSSAVLEFSANPPANWTNVRRDRVRSHFKTFELAQLYASHSAEELNNIRFGLQQMALRNSVLDIKNHIRSIEMSCAAAQINSWQRATYQALANSDWFCQGGFNAGAAVVAPPVLA